MKKTTIYQNQNQKSKTYNQFQAEYADRSLGSLLNDTSNQKDQELLDEPMPTSKMQASKSVKITKTQMNKTNKQKQNSGQKRTQISKKNTGAYEDNF